MMATLYVFSFIVLATSLLHFVLQVRMLRILHKFLAMLRQDNTVERGCRRIIIAQSCITVVFCFTLFILKILHIAANIDRLNRIKDNSTPFICSEVYKNVINPTFYYLLLARPMVLTTIVIMIVRELAKANKKTRESEEKAVMFDQMTTQINCSEVIDKEELRRMNENIENDETFRDVFKELKLLN